MNSRLTAGPLQRAWSRAGLRTRVEVFILLALLPLITLVTLNVLQQRQEDIRHARQQVLLLAQRGAAQQAEILQQVRSSLRMLALIPDVKRADPDRCGGLLRQAMEHHPWSLGFAVANAQGDLLCNGFGLDRISNIADRDYFQHALAAKAFRVSDFRVGPSSGRPMLTAALPILQGQGAVEQVLIAAIDLKWLASVSEEAAQTSGGTVTLLDAKGTVLARVPDSLHLVGQSVRDRPIVRDLLSSAQGVIEGIGLEGAPRIIGFATLDQTGGRIAVGLPRSTVLATVNQKLLWSSGVIVVVVLAIMIGAWFLMDILVLRGLRDLQESASHLSAGRIDDPDRRTSARIQATEVGDAVRAVRSMGQTLHAIAFRDPLTGLPNRRFLDAHIERLGETPQRDAVALLCIDLDGFKPVNDRHGHAIGDAVLTEVGARLAGGVREGDIAARLGGDEFVVLLAMPDGAPPHLPFEVAGRIIQSIAAPIAVEGLELRIGCSVGIALWPTDDPKLDTVLRYADQALYAAKRGGRGQAVRYGDRIAH